MDEQESVTAGSTLDQRAEGIHLGLPRCRVDASKASSLAKEGTAFQDESRQPQNQPLLPERRQAASALPGRMARPVAPTPGCTSGTSNSFTSSSMVKSAIRCPVHGRRRWPVRRSEVIRNRRSELQPDQPRLSVRQQVTIAGSWRLMTRLPPLRSMCNSGKNAGRNSAGDDIRRHVRLDDAARNDDRTRAVLTPGRIVTRPAIQTSAPISMSPPACTAAGDAMSGKSESQMMQCCPMEALSPITTRPRALMTVPKFDPHLVPDLDPPTVAGQQFTGYPAAVQVEPSADDDRATAFDPDTAFDTRARAHRSAMSQRPQGVRGVADLAHQSPAKLRRTCRPEAARGAVWRCNHRSVTERDLGLRLHHTFQFREEIRRVLRFAIVPSDQSAFTSCRRGSA